jgi:hypothetical protein
MAITAADQTTFQNKRKGIWATARQEQAPISHPTVEYTPYRNNTVFLQQKYMIKGIE